MNLTNLNTLATSFARYLALAVIAFSMMMGFASTASAATRTVSCTGDITSALSSAISSSANGDTVSISAGSCSTSRVTMTDKNISIIGAGQGATNITAQNGLLYINVTGANVPSWRVSGLSLSGSGTSVVAIQVWASGSPILRGPFRIDHMDFNYPNNGIDGVIALWGPVYGLIDHNTFTQSYEAFIITNFEVNTETCSYNYAWQGGGCSLTTLTGGTTMSSAYEPGSYRNLYIEDNTFTGRTTNPAFAVDTAYGGGRIVLRHNTLVNSGLYAHWTSAGSVNHLWWEVYNNKFTWNLANNGIYPMRMQGGGTGLIYNNTISGFPGNYILLGEARLPDQAQSGSPLGLCDGTHNWDGNMGDPSAPGWPCLSQTGRDAGKSIAQIQAGQKQASFPMYLWNNGSQDKCYNPGAAGSSCDNSFGVNIYNASGPKYFKSTPHPNGDVDYSITASKPAGAGTHTLSYTPFPYPYPLTANGLPNPTGSGTPTTPTLTASPTSITSGQSSTLSWGSTNATSCTGTGFTASGTSGSVTVSPTTNTTYSVTCTGASGTSPAARVTVTVTSNLPTATLTASPTSITSGQSSTLTWSSTNANSCTGTGFTASGTSGSVTVSPTTNTTYSITCAGASGTSPAASATVAVSAPGTSSAPTFVNEYETAWTGASPKTTGSFAVQTGDVLVASSMSEDAPTTVTISGGSLTWTQQQVVNVTGYGWVSIWTATVDTAKTMSVTYTRATGTNNFGGSVFQFRNASIGTSAKTNVASGAPTLNLTTTQANSAIVVANDDWTALSGTSRVWRTNAGPFTQRSYATVAGAYTIYGGFHPNAGAVGTYAVGLSAPTGQKYSIVAVEVKGQGAVPPPPTPAATATLTATPASITSGSSSTLSWSSTDATSCTGTGFTASATSGSVSVSPTTNTTYSVTCTGTGGSSPAASATVTVTNPVDTTAPSVPTGLSGTGFSTTQIDLTWTASTDDTAVTGYKILRNGTQVGTSATPSYSDTGLTAGTTYAYTVSAYDAAGNESAQSAGVNVATPIVHAAAARLRANPTTITSGQSSTLTWDTYYTNGCTGTNFSTGGVTNGSAVVTPDVTTTYTMVCTGTSGGTVTVRATVTVSGTTAFVVNDRVQTTVNLKVRATPSTSGTTLGTALKGSFGVVVGGPTVADGFTWWNINYDTGADGWSVQDYLTKVDSTGDGVPPSVPTGLSATAISSAQINLTWTASTDNVGVTGYKIFRDGTQVGTSATTSYNDTGLTAATAYSYTVSAYDAAGNDSTQSTSASATTLPATASFAIGDRMVTTANLNVRATPSTSGTLLGTQPLGSLGVLTGGPTVANGFIWWNINYDTGADGWSVQDYIAKTTPIPAVTLTASPTSITSGQSSTLSWSSTNATSCTGTGFTASGTSGSVTVSPTATQTYSITCTGTGGTSPAVSARVTVGASAASASIFTTQVPATLNASDGASVNYELGTLFRSTSSGRITGIRFYKSNLETGTHTGRIWSATGTLLATVVFSGETASGWQAQNLTTPLAITANTTYTVSVNTGNSYYSATSGGLGSAVINGQLSTVVGSNGTYGPVAVFPTNTWNASNYFRDVVFVSDNPGAPVPTVTLTASPASITAGQSSTLSWSSTNATSCTGTGFTASGTSGSVSVSPTGTQTYSITCSGPGGTSLTVSATVNVAIVGGSTCPRGTAIADGCANASAGNPQLPNLFSTPFAPHATPYATRPPWNVAGVDYHVGPPANLVLKDVTVAANRPAGLSYDSVNRVATITANNTTVQGLDFCNAAGGPVALLININVMGSVVTQNKFCAGNFNSYAPILFPYTVNNMSDITFTYNELDGKSPTHSGSGKNFDVFFEDWAGGHVTFEYNFIHDVDTKAVRLDGPYPSTCDCIVYAHNLTYNFGMNTGNTGTHAEELFNYKGGYYEGRVIAFNTSITQMWNVWGNDRRSALTANYNVGDEAADMFHTPLGNFNRNKITNNVIINEGDAPPSGPNHSGPAAYNFQIGCNGGTCDNNVIKDNYLDSTGGFYAWFDLFGTITFSDVSGNKSLVTGGTCNPNTWKITGGGTGTGSCVVW